MQKGFNEHHKRHLDALLRILANCVSSTSRQLPCGSNLHSMPNQVRMGRETRVMIKMSEDIFECFRAGIRDADGANPCAHDTAYALFNEAERARRVESEQTGQLRQKDEAIRALADSLERMTHIATGLHALYRGTAQSESDGSHEKAFADALALVKKVRGS